MEITTDFREMVAQSIEHEHEVVRLRNLARAYGAEEHELHAVVVLSKTSTSSTQLGLKAMAAKIVQLNTRIAR